MSHNIEIQDGACIISDAHFSHLRGEFELFLDKIISKEFSFTQLIFLGDIFDALFGGINFTKIKNITLIEKINNISNNLPIIYLEGNHDYNLKKIFPNVKVIPISKQPILCKFYDKKVYLAHGDFDGAIGYKIYTYLIRNRVVLFFLEILDSTFNHFILNWVDKHLSTKNDCKEFKGFEDFISKRLSKKFDCDYFIEGHFHQNCSFLTKQFYYTNLGAFACNQRYFIVKSLQGKMLLEEKNL
jgi:UDP-2,3-diacylglucosamine hydrolase